MDVNGFWEKLCTDLNYHFFTGVPNESLKDIFNTLNPDFLHFVPTVNDSTAVGLAAGVCLSGYKSVVLCDNDSLLSVKVQINNFVIKHNIPILFITDSVQDVGLKSFDLIDGLSVLDKADAYMECEKLPVTLKI
jgi:sulfopyruvate decarboxylase TPP-binding subunit